jgi:steroid delta-isomerase-like uncharacterized protein
MGGRAAALCCQYLSCWTRALLPKYTLQRDRVSDKVALLDPRATPNQEGRMSVEKNIELMRRWFKEVWNEGKTETIHELLAPDAVGVGELEDGRPVHGPAEFIPFVNRIRGAFPDVKIQIEDAFGAGDKVVLRWSATMTHRGDHLGMPATGRPVQMTGITIARILDNKIIEGWDNWDQLGMLKQIGLYEPALLKSA